MISNFLTHKVKRKKRSPRNDPQRNRLYKVEREFIGVSVNANVSKVDLQDIANHVCRHFKLPLVKIVVVDQPWEKALGWCESWSIDGGAPFDFKIYMNRGFHGTSMCVLLHEMSHYVTDSYWKGHEIHGPEFVAVYMYNLNKYRIMPEACFRVLAKKYKVKFGHKATPAALRGRERRG